MQADLDRLKKKHGNITALTKKAEKIQREIDLQKAVRFSMNTVSWSKVTEKIAKLKPRNIWLTRLEGKGRQILVQGVALKNSQIAYFMSLLEKSNRFSTIAFTYSMEKFINTHSVVDFEIRITISDDSKDI